MSLLAAVAFFAGFCVLVYVDLGKRDRRFKTGYKNNVVPTQIPFKQRLKWTGILWSIAILCSLSLHALVGLIAFGIAITGAVGTWLLYPQFWSRFQRNSTSNAAFVTARLTTSVAVGGLTAYFFVQILIAESPIQVPAVVLRTASPSIPNHELTPTVQAIDPPAVEVILPKVDSSQPVAAQAQFEAQQTVLNGQTSDSVPPSSSSMVVEAPSELVVPTTADHLKGQVAPITPAGASVNTGVVNMPTQQTYYQKFSYTPPSRQTALPPRYEVDRFSASVPVDDDIKK